jgi:UDP-N-acetylglucosamine--N-acetylmuramyl-(pentapeptide) pyrophosphoryl-undecaprenol N-acetylglucosamine transferase
MNKIFIACGGTGGHLAPGIAVAEALNAQGKSCILLISQKQIDSTLIQKYKDLKFEKIPGRGFTGSWISRLLTLGSMLRSFWAAWHLLKREKPDLVFLFGGFISAGMGLAARTQKVPIVLHEANCTPGKVTRLLKQWAIRIYLPDGVQLKGNLAKQIRYFGYPVRKEIKHILKAEAWEILGIKVPRKLLVVIGGSQGASALNDWAFENFKTIAEAGITIYCVSGPGKNLEGTQTHINAQGEAITFTNVHFSDEMGAVISGADLVISRAGAGSIAEMIRCRAPAILIPYPHAADGHQISNAEAHERHGAGVSLLENNLNQLTSEVKQLIFNDWMLAQFKSNLVRLDRFDSTLRVAQDIEALCQPPVSSNLESESFN